MPVDPFELDLMRQIARQSLAPPLYGWPRMPAALRRQGYRVNGKRIRRLMRRMGLQAITLRKRIATSTPGHRVYPYLLRDLTIDQPNQVWCTDSTYVPMRQGFAYLVVVMDWRRRAMLTWALANSLEGSFGRPARQQALATAPPTICNSDQGSQVTASGFTSLREAAKVQISMDGRGRVFDTRLVERLWRPIKYEHLYRHDDRTMTAVECGLTAYIAVYNTQRLQQRVGDQTPAEVYRGASCPVGDG